MENGKNGRDIPWVGDQLQLKGRGLDADEAALDARREKALEAIGHMEGVALEREGAWAVRRTYLDPAHKDRPAEYSFVEADQLGILVDGADAKNGVDAGTHREGRHRSFVIIASGSEYDSPAGKGIVREAFECRLLTKESAADYRERLNAGWSDRGEGPQKLFHSASDQQPLSPKRSKSRDTER